MCQFSKTNQMTVIDQDITVYKLGIPNRDNSNEMRSADQLFMYTLGLKTVVSAENIKKNMVSTELVDWKTLKVHKFYQFYFGLHSFTNLKEAKKFYKESRLSSVQIYQATIPAGSMVIRGRWKIDGDHTMVSDQLIINEIIPYTYKS